MQKCHSSRCGAAQLRLPPVHHSALGASANASSNEYTSACNSAADGNNIYPGSLGIQLKTYLLGIYPCVGWTGLIDSIYSPSIPCILSVAPSSMTTEIKKKKKGHRSLSQYNRYIGHKPYMTTMDRM